MTKRTALAPLILIISIVILLLFAFYYLNSAVTNGVLNMQYLSQDYMSYQQSLYYIFVYIPFEIRYNLINSVLKNLYSGGNIYQLGYIFGNTPSVYSQSCQIPFVDDLTPSSNNNYNNPENNNNYNYLLCIPILYVEQCQNINQGLTSGLLYDVTQSLETINDPVLSFSGFVLNSNCNFYLQNVLYNFTATNEYSRILNLNNIEYPWYPYAIYYNYIVLYIYNNTYQLFNYVINNQNRFEKYSKYVYSNQTIGDEVLLNLYLNNTPYYALDLYYNTLLPPGQPNITNITIPLPCESLGQENNGICITNSTYQYYEYKCLYQNTTLPYILEQYGPSNVIINPIFFQGYWDNVTSIVYSYPNQNFLPDLLDCSNTVNFAENMIGNYTYFTEGNYPILFPVNINVNYDRLYCTISNQYFTFGPYAEASVCGEIQSAVSSLIDTPGLNLNYVCSVTACYPISIAPNAPPEYQFNVYCYQAPYSPYVGSFSYNYQIYEGANLNKTNVNSFCSTLQ